MNYYYKYLKYKTKVSDLENYLGGMEHRVHFPDCMTDQECIDRGYTKCQRDPVYGRHICVNEENAVFEEDPERKVPFRALPRQDPFSPRRRQRSSGTREQHTWRDNFFRSTQTPAKEEKRREDLTRDFFLDIPKDTLDVLYKLMKNIIKNPSEAKYRKVKFSNTKINKTIGQSRKAQEVLLSLGFISTTEMSDGRSYLVLEFPASKQINNTQWKRVGKLILSVLEDK